MRDLLRQRETYLSNTSDAVRSAVLKETARLVHLFKGKDSNLCKSKAAVSESPVPVDVREDFADSFNDLADTIHAHFTDLELLREGLNTIPSHLNDIKTASANSTLALQNVRDTMLVLETEVHTLRDDQKDLARRMVCIDPLFLSCTLCLQYFFPGTYRSSPASSCSSVFG